MSITEQSIIDAQNSWGAAVVAVGAAPSWDEAHSLATQLVKSHYLLEERNLLFCPTKASVQQFRGTLKEAVSYFVGNDPDHEEDGGFALEPWSSVRFENQGIVIKDEMGIAMGNYFFGKADGSELKVEYTFAYVLDASGDLKIQLHHSALPFGH